MSPSHSSGQHLDVKISALIMRGIFEEALLIQDYAAAVNILRRVVAALSSARNEGSAANVARVMNNHRAICASLSASCDFAYSFEQSFPTRAGLLLAGAADPLLDALPLISWSMANVSAAADALQKLSLSEDGRNVVGKRGVTCLLLLWKQLPHCLEIVQALVSLCAGHVDNVSRFTGDDGMQLCIHACNLAQSNAKQQARQLMLESLLLMGECCLCLPDPGKGDALVPAVLNILQATIGDRRLGPRVAIAAAQVLANIDEAVFREELSIDSSDQVVLDGYSVPDRDLVLQLLLKVWDAWPNNRDVVSSVTWALCALSRSNKADFAARESKKYHDQVRSRLLSCPHAAGSVRALHKIVHTASSLIETRTM